MFLRPGKVKVQLHTFLTMTVDGISSFTPRRNTFCRYRLKRRQDWPQVWTFRRVENCHTLAGHRTPVYSNRYSNWTLRCYRCAVARPNGAERRTNVDALSQYCKSNGMTIVFHIPTDMNIKIVLLRNAAGADVLEEPAASSSEQNRMYCTEYN